MSKLTDRISYLKGMAAGMKLNMDKDSNKLMLEMLTVMGEMAEEMAAEDDDEDEFGEDDLIVYACPHCGHEIEFHASDVDFDEDCLCPECQKPIFPELSEDE